MIEGNERGGEKRERRKRQKVEIGQRERGRE